MGDAKVYQLKITLTGAKPPIWRRIQILDTDFTFKSLHNAVQDAMGWNNCHLYYFEAMNHKEKKKVRIDSCSDMFDGLPDDKCLIRDYFVEVNDKAYYEYDMGDSWAHWITLEKILPEDKNMKYPRCLAGKRACPPEDCGGVYQYMWLVDEVLKDNKHKEHKHYKSWLKSCGHLNFNPEHFDPNTAFKDWKDNSVVEAAD